ncbi:hypothetical protein GCM10011578_077340 [Streptomyces fuscichromogenes]|uniref:Uncharacterized protein n=1 Tax=Streptomyces fuscichromogenes TaxID=1324013 RepID=A0A917XLN5_9ACTN|nr:hypothetical protein GCM10011578_077340 [Streptomyces fuscichromogenes]
MGGVISRLTMRGAGSVLAVDPLPAPGECLVQRCCRLLMVSEHKHDVGKAGEAMGEGRGAGVGQLARGVVRDPAHGELVAPVSSSVAEVVERSDQLPGRGAWGLCDGSALGGEQVAVLGVQPVRHSRDIGRRLGAAAGDQRGELDGRAMGIQQLVRGVGGVGEAVEDP